MKAASLSCRLALRGCRLPQHSLLLSRRTVLVVSRPIGYARAAGGTAQKSPASEAPDACLPAEHAEPVGGALASLCELQEQEVDLAERARALSVSLSPWEVRALVRMILDYEGARVNTSQTITPSKLQRFVRQRLETEWERETIVHAISATHADSPAQRMLTAVDFLGSTLFAVVGTLIAGDAGMNVVGATFVGCIAAMGGGTVNNIMMGNTRGGVFWMRDPRFLYVAVAASVITFYLWPRCEVMLAHLEWEAIKIDGNGMRDFQQSQELEAIQMDDDGMIDFQQFETALDRDPALASRIRSAVQPLMQTKTSAQSADPTAAELFQWLDFDNTGQIGAQALQRLVRLKTVNSKTLYVMDAVALGAFGVIGAQHGITCGMRPSICVVSGITICFGGIIRDMLCQRNIALGSQSYAMAMGCGALVYVGLRQMVVRGWPIPLMYRIILGAGTTVGLRFLDWQNNLLPPMMTRSK